MTTLNPCSRGTSTYLAHVHNYLARFSAFSLVAASTTFGCVYAWGVGSMHGTTLGVAAVAMALGLEVAKPLAVAGILDSLKSWHVGRAVAMLLLAVVAVAYSLTAELSLQARSRADGITERATENRNIAAATRQKDRYQKEADALGPLVRSSSEVQADIHAKLTSRKDLNGCAMPTELKADAARKVCRDVAGLRIDAAKTVRVETAQADLKSAENVLAEYGAERKTDPGASALASYLAVFGVRVSAEVLGDWLVLVAVVALEVGSIFAGVLVTTPTGHQPDTPDHNRQPEPKTEPVKPPSNMPIQPQIKVDGGTDQSTRERVLSLILDAGGTVRGSQRSLSTATGCSRTRFNEVVEVLAKAGRVKVRAGSTGTTITLSEATTGSP